MRRLPLVAMPFSLYLFCAAIVAQTICPPPNGIQDCPNEGCGGWDKQLDIKKNYEAAPHSKEAVPHTLEKIKLMNYPEQWFVGKERTELEKLGEGTYVEVIAYLIGVRYGDATSANCKLTDPQAVDQLLILVSEDALKKPRFGDREITSVTAVLTPRVRLKHSSRERLKTGKEVFVTNWTKWKLDALKDRTPQGALKVRIKGLLLLDTEHIFDPLYRSTDWKIHPVLDIEVMCANAHKCQNAGEWMKLDDLKIKDLPPKPRGPNPRGDLDRIP